MFWAWSPSACHARAGYRAAAAAWVSKRSTAGTPLTTAFDTTMALPAAPWPSITPWLKTPPTRYQTSVLGSRSRTFSAKVFNGAAAALFGAACFLAAFFGFLPGADIFLAGFVAALFVGFVDAVV